LAFGLKEQPPQPPQPLSPTFAVSFRDTEPRKRNPAMSTTGPTDYLALATALRAEAAELNAWGILRAPQLDDNADNARLER